VSLDLITVGESFEDLVFFHLPRIPGPGEEIKTNDFRRTVGGGVIITAVTAARLGLHCSVVSALGSPAIELLNQEGIAHQNLLEDGEHQAVSVALSTDKNRSFVTYNGTNAELEGRLHRRIDKLEAKHVHFAFYPRNSGRWAEVVNTMRTRQITTSWDFGWNEGLGVDEGFHDLLAGTDYVFINEDEARLYSGASTVEASLAFWKAHTVNTILKTGDRGCRWLGPERDLLSPAVPTETVDTTGAGDAFNGGFLYALHRGEPAERCLHLANHVASLSTRAPGGIAGLPGRNEIT
jgi:sugar/nucleoside kinase (ribokinase family)